MTSLFRWRQPQKVALCAANSKAGIGYYVTVMKPSLAFGLLLAISASAQPIQVLVWDEQQPRQSEAYDNFLGNEIAAYLKDRPGIDVRSVRHDDPEHGLTKRNLDEAEVLIWWGHVRQAEVPREAGQDIVERIKSGRLSMITLHSAHWSVPFMEAMFERTRIEARRRFPHPDTKIEFIEPPGRIPPTYDSIVTPAYYAFQRRAIPTQVRVDLPNCVFPGFRPDGQPSVVTVLKPDHPIAKGLPATFEIPQTEMYDEPFHVPAPDQVIFQEDWRHVSRGNRVESGPRQDLLLSARSRAVSGIQREIPAADPRERRPMAGRRVTPSIRLLELRPGQACLTPTSEKTRFLSVGARHASPAFANARQAHPQRPRFAAIVDYFRTNQIVTINLL